MHYVFHRRSPPIHSGLHRSAASLPPCPPKLWIFVRGVFFYLCGSNVGGAHSPGVVTSLMPKEPVGGHRVNEKNPGGAPRDTVEEKKQEGNEMTDKGRQAD